MILQLRVAWRVPDSGLLLVLPFAVEVDSGKIEKTDTPAYNDGNLGRDIARSVLGLEGLWSTAWSQFQLLLRKWFFAYMMLPTQ